MLKIEFHETAGGDGWEWTVREVGWKTVLLCEGVDLTLREAMTNSELCALRKKLEIERLRNERKETSN